MSGFLKPESSVWCCPVGKGQEVINKINDGIQMEKHCSVSSWLHKKEDGVQTFILPTCIWYSHKSVFELNIYSCNLLFILSGHKPYDDINKLINKMIFKKKKKVLVYAESVPRRRDIYMTL